MYYRTDKNSQYKKGVVILLILPVVYSKDMKKPNRPRQSLIIEGSIVFGVSTINNLSQASVIICRGFTDGSKRSQYLTGYLGSLLYPTLECCVKLLDRTLPNPTCCNT